MSSSEIDEILEDYVPEHTKEFAVEIITRIMENFYDYEMETGRELKDLVEEVAVLLHKEQGKQRPSALSFADYQRLSRRTAIYPKMGRNVVYPTLGLTGEVSETVVHLLNLVLGLIESSGNISESTKKTQRDDAGILTEAKREQIVKELGDILWYVSALSAEIGVPLHRVAEENIVKLHDRKKRGKIKGSGDNR